MYFSFSGRKVEQIQERPIYRLFNMHRLNKGCRIDHRQVMTDGLPRLPFIIR